MSPSPITQQALTLVVLVAIAYLATASDAKLLRRSRLFDDSPYGGGYDSPYGSGGAMATGERAIVTVRGARHPYDGSAPSKIAIEDNPYRGPYPRGIYDRADGYSRRQRMPIYPNQDYGYSGYPGGYGSGAYGNGGYGSGYNPMFGAPSRIAVTGAYPVGYGMRF